MPKTVHGITVPGREDEGQYIIISDVSGLISLVQLGTLEFHPWGSRADKPGYPDRLFFDLDPDEKLPLPIIVEDTYLLKDYLDRLGLTSFVKTSGGKGYHVVVPLMRRTGWQELKDFTKAVAKDMVKRYPSLFVYNMSKVKRQGKIFIDYLRNQEGATNVAAYSLRAKPGAPVSMPIFWDELPVTSPTKFTIENSQERLAGAIDPWDEFWGIRQALTRSMKKQLHLR